MRNPLALIPACLLAAAAHAAPPAPATRAEIDALLQQLQASGCEFQRNGSWHSAADAQAHLRTKLEHMERQGTIRSAEDFITMGASESSLSGRPYRVRCAGAEPVESRAWLLERLRAVRQVK